MKIKIIGDGVFGSFLKEIFAPHVEYTNTAEHIFLAVPINAYAEVAQKHSGKHLINVCSVQHESNKICAQYSDRVTGIHPLFGPRSPKANRVSVLTKSCKQSFAVISLFEKIGSEVYDKLPTGELIDGELHDRMMSVTHLAGLQQLENLKEIVEKAAWVPQKFIPTSFQRLQNFVEQSGDFSPGTLSSIEANPFNDRSKSEDRN